jgi:serine/threonine-protein kinase RsbW
VSAQYVPTDGREPVHAPGFSFHSRLDLACEPSAVRYARGHAQDTLRQWGVPADASYEAITIVAELASNAVRHAGADAEPFDSAQGGQPRVRSCSLALWISDHKLYISMFDESLEAPVLRPDSADSESGRGLQLIAGLSEGTWGFDFTDFRPGKRVWACLRLPVAAPHDGPGHARRSHAGRRPRAFGAAGLPGDQHAAVSRVNTT